jgi:hypothetical protein
VIISACIQECISIKGGSRVEVVELEAFVPSMLSTTIFSASHQHNRLKRGV